MLIDVHDQRIVLAAEKSAYAVLSYTWGDSTQFLTTQSHLDSLMKPGELLKRPLPSTVRDAVELTKNIGLDYLWVDAVCIIQDSEEHKAKQIARMHHIYGGAAVTIVAASSKSADDGLSGVGGLGRDTDQDIIAIDGLRLMARQCFLDVTMNRSAYNKRAWTYQESCLSRRLLYVTSKGVSMICCQSMRSEELALEDSSCATAGCTGHTMYLDSSQRNLWREFITREIDFLKPHKRCSCIFEERRRFVEGMLPSRPHSGTARPGEPIDPRDQGCEACVDFQREISTEFHIYKDLVRGYTHRQMRYEADRVHAFDGINRLLEVAFQRHYYHAYRYDFYGKYLDMQLLWRPIQNRVHPCRREHLAHVPTWSWASHEITVMYPGDTWVTSEVDWYNKNARGELLWVRSVKFLGNHAPLRDDFRRAVTQEQLDSDGVQFNLDDDSFSKMRLYGWCQVCTCFYVKDLRLWDENKQPIDPEWNEVMYSDCIPATSSEFMPVELCFISRSHHADLNPRGGFRNGDWDLEEHSINLLVIETEDGYSKRVAITSIFNTALWKGAKKEWRLIKLI